MADLPSHARVVVIGGGIVGCSALYHLARAGWTDLVLVEKNELTSGSTWHAAGNCPNFAGGWGVMKMQNYSTRLYQRLGEEVDYPINYSVTGALRLAHTAERMREFEHVRSMAAYQGIPMEMVSRADMARLCPVLETHDLEGGLWDAADGDIDPAQVTQAFAKGARDLGAHIIRFCPVIGLTRHPFGHWDVETEMGIIHAEIIINTAGYRAGEIGRMMGRSGGLDVPSVSMSHQYLMTEDIPELAARDAKIPMIRDPDVSYYLRQERHGLILGPYERQATPYWIRPEDPMPADFSFQLWPDDLDRIESYVEDACARMPILGAAGVRKVINGPIPYAPDGLPLVGPVPGLRNAFEACGFTFGIVQGGGAGKVIADWIIEGAPEWDMWAIDPRRFTDFATKSYAVAKAKEVYANEYAIQFPELEWPDGRPSKTSSLYEILKAKGAQFGARGGWEKPTWFAPPGAADMAMRSSYDRADWFDSVAAEVQAVQEGVGLLDLTAFGRFELKGPGAAAWLDGMIAGALPKPGRITLAYFCTKAGRILTEMTITRFADDHFWLLTAVGAQWHDDDWLRLNMPDQPKFTLEDITAHWGTLVVAGPKSRDVLAPAVDCDLSNGAFPWLTHQPVRIGAAQGVAIRVNYVGELGWELHMPMEALADVYRAVWAAGEAHGISDFGVYAMESMRLEKCYRSWKGDLSTDYSPLTGALDRFVRLQKPADFIGKAALLAEREAGSPERFVPLIVEAGRVDAIHLSTVWKGDQAVGLVTSGGYGHRIGKSIALAYVRNDLAVEGEALEVEIFGERRPAVVGQELLYDPDNERLRA
ncbi:MAG: FAD-dependent oxidoreductase [Inquilinus sp.]|nr:FAD-dependent oxidoreductase [Inquilinus sp.]